MKPSDTIRGLRAYRHHMMARIRSGECTDDEKRRYLFEFSFKSNGPGNLGGKFNLKRFVRNMDTALTVVCSDCGMPARCSYDKHTNQQMMDHQRCFYCSLWDSRRGALTSCPIVNGTMYSVRPARNPHTSDKSMMGHGGATYLLKPIGEGKEMFSNDVWNGGSIPSHMRAEFPDTYTMESLSPKDYADMYFSSEESRDKLADELQRHFPRMSREEAKFHLSYCFWSVKRVLNRYNAHENSQFKLEPYEGSTYVK